MVLLDKTLAKFTIEGFIQKHSDPKGWIEF